MLMYIMIAETKHAPGHVYIKLIFHLFEKLFVIHIFF